MIRVAKKIIPRIVSSDITQNRQKEKEINLKNTVIIEIFVKHYYFSNIIGQYR